MALQQITLTLTTVAVQAVTAHTPFKYLRIENEAGNALVKYGLSTLTSTDYAGSVPADTATVTNAIVIGAFDTLPSNLDEFYFLGTNAQKIHLTVIS